MSRYRLVFNGDLQPGVERTACVQALARTFRESPHKLAERLFSGKRVVVKKTDDEKTAEKLMKAFEKAGGILSLETETPDYKTTRKRETLQRPDAQAAGSMDDPEATMDDKATRKREKMHPPPGYGYQAADMASDDDVTRQRPAVGEEDDRPNRRRRRRHRR